jgi:lysozyme family protein
VSPIESVIALVLKNEGGVADVGDGVGVTHFGQTAGWLETHHLPVPATKEDAAINYAQWITKTGLYHVASADDALTRITIDFAVMNEGRAIRALQAAIGARPDGVIGPQTRRALETIDRHAVAVKVLADWNRFLGATITAIPQRAVYAKGWANRISGHMETL